MSANGTHKLTPEEQEQMRELFPATKYLHVETGVHGVGANRAGRRRGKFKPRYGQ